jgi:NTE family protein
MGLVFGAGGVAGQAYHAGMLSALADLTGWDPRTAEVVVGTSAGALMAVGLRAGFSAADLAARATDDPLSTEGAALIAQAPPDDVDPEALPAVDRSRGPAAPELLRRAARRPWEVPPGSLAAAALPAGTRSTAAIRSGVTRFLGDSWPEAELWVCAVSLETGRLVVFGHPDAHDADGAEVTPGLAVAASCAIPGYFAPVEIGGVRYVDGAVASPTSADVLAGRNLDLVIVSAPMSVMAGEAKRPWNRVSRGVSRVLLTRESARLRRSGTAVIAVEPTAGDIELMSHDAMEARHRAAVTRHARETTLRRLAQPAVQALLGGLTDQALAG